MRSGRSATSTTRSHTHAAVAKPSTRWFRTLGGVLTQGLARTEERIRRRTRVNASCLTDSPRYRLSTKSPPSEWRFAIVRAVPLERTVSALNVLADNLLDGRKPGPDGEAEHDHAPIEPVKPSANGFCLLDEPTRLVDVARAVGEDLDADVPRALENNDLPVVADSNHIIRGEALGKSRACQYAVTAAHKRINRTSSRSGEPASTRTPTVAIRS